MQVIDPDVRLMTNRGKRQPGGERKRRICGVGCSAQSDQQSQGQKRTHRICSAPTGQASGPSVARAAASWDRRGGRLGAGGKLPDVDHVVRAIVAPSCSGFTISQIGGMMSAMATLAIPQKITFAEMRESGARGLLVYCADYHRSQSVRLSDIEPR